MKQRIYILGVITSLVIFLGTIFKVNHFPGAGILLTLGLGTFIVFFLPVAIMNSYKASEIRHKKLLYIVTYVTCFVVFTGMLFKIQHWPYAGTFLTVGLAFPYVVFLPVFITVTSKDKNFNIYNTVAVLLLLAVNSVFSVLLALNVTKTRLDDSYNLSHNYNRLETVLNQIPDRYQQSPVNLKIDEVLKTVNEYQDMILKHEELSRQQWESNPGLLWRPTAGGVAAEALLVANEAFPGEKLEKGIKDLILEFGKIRGCEELAKATPVIFNYKEPVSIEDHWAGGIFNDNSLSWALMYLDALQVNLITIKLSLNMAS